MGNYQIRTDLALEARESVDKKYAYLCGVREEEYSFEKENVHVTKVYIDSKNAAKLLGKPVGIYVTIDAPNIVWADEDYHREISKCFADEILKLVPDLVEKQSILVVGLGNRKVTADSLGPRVLDNLQITRHILRQFGRSAYDNKKVFEVSCIEPQVMAKTGMETLEIVKGVVEETKPDIVFVVDSLASRSTKRLNRTIQLTNTGIHPGSGVGNYRSALTRDSLGIDVIAIGIPTVVDAATIVLDAFCKVVGDKKMKNMMVEFSKEREELFSELNNMYMTGKDIDELVKRISYTISEGLNMIFGNPS